MLLFIQIRDNLVFIIIFLVTIITGCIITIRVGKNEILQDQANLEKLAKVAVASINPDNIATLSGSSDDIEKAEWKFVRNQLIEIQKTTEEIRWLYTMRMKENKIYFTIDSTPDSSKDYASPGTAYTEAPNELLNVFNSGQGTTLGPYTDRWGTFISTFIPIIDRRTKKVINVLGMDINARDWNYHIIRSQSISIGITVLFILLQFILFIYIKKRKKIEKSLHRAHDELELRVTERTTQLANMNKELNNKMIELKKTDEALRESERQFWAFLNSTDDCVFLKDYDGKFMFVNYAMANTFGLNENEIIGKTDFDLLPAMLAQKYSESDQKALNSEEVIVFEETDGKNIYESRKFKIHLKENKLGVGGITRNITENKKLERQIIQSEKMAVVGQLAGGIAHDLNNILTTLIGNTEFLSRKICKNCKTSVNRYIDSLFMANNRAKNIVLQILAFSKRQQVIREVIDLNEIITEMVKMLSRLIPENIKINKNIGDTKLLIETDISQIEQIIMNLVINSRDAIKDNGIIEIITRKEKIAFDIIARNGIIKPGEYVLLIIKDSGSGIPVEIMDKIFDPFFTTKEIGKGTGLGLSIVLNNLIKNDGFLNVYSEAGKGTEFRIFFSLVKEPEKSRKEKLDSEVGLGNGEKILIVEDDDAIRFLLTEYLEDVSYKVFTAKNGIEALDILMKERVDALLTDITMPEMGGKELFEKIKEKNINVPIIAMSGYFQYAEIKDIGFYSILDKPLDMIKVLSVLHNIFKERSKT